MNEGGGEREREREVGWRENQEERVKESAEFRMQSLGRTEWEKRRYRGKTGAKEWAGGKGMNE